MNQNESLLDLLILLYKWRKKIFLGTLLSAIIAAVVSLFLPNYYQANTLFYAASPDLAQPMGSTLEKRIYGSDSDLDRLFSIAQSNEVKYYLAEKFKLYDHYKIDTTNNKAKQKMLLKLEKLYKTNKTKYDAISLVIEDTDPELAAIMANDVRDHINNLSRDILKKSQWGLIKSLKDNIDKKNKEYALLTDSLYNIRSRHNIFNTASQGEAYGSSIVSLEGKVQNLGAQVDLLKRINGPRDSINVLRAKLAGSTKQLEVLKTNIKDYNEGYPAIVNIERERKEFGNQLSYDKERLSKLEAVYYSDINAIHTMQEADVPVMKSRPKRSILVIGIALISFILLSLWVIIQDQYAKNNWRELLKNA